MCLQGLSFGPLISRKLNVIQITLQSLRLTTPPRQILRARPPAVGSFCICGLENLLFYHYISIYFSKFWCRICAGIV